MRGHLDRAAGGLRRDPWIQLGVRREAPRAVDDHPHREPDLAVDDGRLQLTVAQLHDLVDDAVDPQVGVAGAGAGRGRQRGVGKLRARQLEEVGIDLSVRCHG